MEKEFIPYEQALELKELGFKEECLGYFTDKILYTDHTGNVVKYFKSEVNAPLYQQAAQFLYLKSNKQINFQIDGSNSYEELCEKLKKSIKDFRDLQNSKS